MDVLKDIKISFPFICTICGKVLQKRPRLDGATAIHARADIEILRPYVPRTIRRKNIALCLSCSEILTEIVIGIVSEEDD